MRGGFGGGMGMGGMMRGGPGVWAQERHELRTPIGVLLRRVGEVVGEQRRTLSTALLTVFLSSALQMVPPYATRYVIDEVIPRSAANVIPAIALGLIGLHALRYLLLWASRIAVTTVSQQLV